MLVRSFGPGRVQVHSVRGSHGTFFFFFLSGKGTAGSGKGR